MIHINRRGLRFLREELRAPRSLNARHRCRVDTTQNAVVRNTRMYPERTLLGFALLSRKAKNARRVFLLSVRRLLYLILSDVIKGMKADCNSL